MAEINVLSEMYFFFLLIYEKSVDFCMLYMLFLVCFYFINVKSIL